MRLFLTIAALAAFALSAQAGTPGEKVELRQLEQRLQPLVLALSPRTTGDDVLTALKPGRSEVYDECADGCFVGLNFDGGKDAPYFGFLDRQAASLSSKAYYAGKPFTADTWRLSVTIDPDAGSGLCFSVETWNAALKTAGWPPLTTMATTYSVSVSDTPAVVEGNDTAAATQRDVAGKMFQSINGVKRITLFTAPEALRGRVSSPHNIAEVTAMGDCVRVITAGSE